MKQIDRKVLLNKLQAEVQQHISETETLFQHLDAEALNRPSASGGWSILQCLDHLNSYGDYYLPVITAKLTNAPDSAVSAFQSSWLGDYFRKMMDPDTGKTKYKAFKGHIPAQALDAGDVLEKFIVQQQTMIGLLAMASAKNLRSVTVPISIASFIKLRVGDVFQFLIAHNERHMRQAKRNLNTTDLKPLSSAG